MNKATRVKLTEIYPNLGIKRVYYLLFAEIIIFGLLIASSLSFPIEFARNTFSIDDEPMVEAGLPYQRMAGSKDELTANLDFSLESVEQLRLDIIPDDCVVGVRLNSQDIELFSVAARNLCNHFTGFSLVLPQKLLRDGSNQLEVKVKNRGGLIGIDAKLSSLPAIQCGIGTKLLFSLLFGHIAYLIFRLFTLQRTESAIIAIGAALRAHYLSYTDYTERAYDVVFQGGHLDFIQFVAENFILPPATGGWEYHQNPLYYLLFGSLMRLVRPIAEHQQVVFLQFISILVSLGLVLFGRRLLLLFCSSQKNFAYLISLSLLVFWPSGVIHSVRISNDGLFYFFFVGAMYFIASWKQSHSGNYTKPFFMGWLFGLMAFATKTTGVIMFPVIAFAVLAEKFSSRISLPRPGIALILVASLVLVVWLVLFDNVSAFLRGETVAILTANTSLSYDRRFTVGTTLSELFLFHPTKYIESPFAHHPVDAGLHLHQILKTSLFAWAPIPGQFALGVSRALLFLLPFLVLGSIAGYFLASEEEWRVAQPLFWAGVLLLVALLYFRVTLPISWNSDFRFVFPTLLPVLVFHLLALQKFKQRGCYFRYGMMCSFAIFFVFLSIGLFIMPFDGYSSLC